MPHLVQMQKQFGDKGLSVITMSLDRTQRDRDRALKFLNDAQIMLTNLAANPADKAFETALKNVNFIPHQRIYDRNGQLVFDKAGTPAEIDEQVNRLLNQN